MLISCNNHFSTKKHSNNEEKQCMSQKNKIKHQTDRKQIANITTLELPSDDTYVKHLHKCTNLLFNLFLTLTKCQKIYKDLWEPFINAF